jgi:hypothetical protein
LPLVLLLIVVLSLAAAGALGVVGAERRGASKQIDQLQAYAAARSGLERYLADRASFGFTSIPPAASESTRVMLPSGYADVVLERVHAAGGASSDLYLIRARGVHTTGGTETAERTIAQYARWQGAAMGVLGAVTSLSGVVKSDGFGVVSGYDACGLQPAVAGVAVPTTPGYVQGSGTPVPSGLPDIRDLGPVNVAKEALHIDWMSIREHGYPNPDTRDTGEGWPFWSESSSEDPWPAIVTTGNLTLPSDGHGLLVVMGDLTVDGTRSWSGLVLVARQLKVTGSFSVNGAVIAGLDAAWDPTVPPSDLGAGGVSYRYNSCAIAQALSRYAGLAPFTNASVDNWPTR